MRKVVVIMEKIIVRYNEQKEERKILVKLIGKILGTEPVYLGAPSFAYEVGGCIVDRYGTVSFNEHISTEEAELLIEELYEEGYEGEREVGDTVLTSEGISMSNDMSESSIDNFKFVATGNSSSLISSYKSIVDEVGHSLTIEVPLVGFSDTALNNLERLVISKADLIKKAIGTDKLPIDRTANMLRFPWFPVISSNEDVDAYARFIHGLCELSKKQQRVILREKDVDTQSSEKFAFRCFLLRLGFIGKDYKTARKILLSKLSGSGSFKTEEAKERHQAKTKGYPNGYYKIIDQ